MRQVADSRRRPPAEEAVHFPGEEMGGEVVVKMGLVVASVVNGPRSNGLMGRNGKNILFFIGNRTGK